MNVGEYLYNRFVSQDTMWTHERENNLQKLDMAGAKTFTEQCLDQHLMNWIIQAADKFYPALKRVLVDLRDEDIYKQIDKSEGKRIVAVVNQWHMEGIEHHWCHSYGQSPRNMITDEEINPIGDMELRRGLFHKLFNQLQRQVKSANSLSHPVTYSDWITGYNREANWQYEHRDM